MKLRRWIPVLASAALLLPAVAPVSAQDDPAAPELPAQFGEVFPSSTLENLNAGAGGPPSIDLSKVIGKRPVVLYYWVAGNSVADEVFSDLQTLADEQGPVKLALFGVATERPGLGRDKIMERVRALKIHVPVLNDQGFKIGKLLQVRHVPSISVLDSEGKLRLTNAGSLRQTLEYNMDVGKAIERVASGSTLGTYGPLPRWYPVKELIGQPCPDFEAPVIANGEVRRWSSMIAPDKVNVLMFWSVDCPHCRKALPELNEWLKTNSEGINVVGAAGVNDQAGREKTKEFCDGNGFVFPTLVDENLEIGGKFRVVSTPTFVIVGPDGVIDSVVLTGESDDLAETLQAKKKELLSSAGASGT